MAIAFNLPSEREASEENFSRLNRLLTELYDVLCHILVSRQPSPEPQDTRRDRPFSDSEVDRRTQDLPPNYRPISASLPPALIFEDDLEDDVFVSPRMDNGNDPFSTRNVEIFGFGSQRTPAGLLLSPRRDRRFSFSTAKEKNMRDKGGTEIGPDELDATPEEASSNKESTSSDSSIFSSILTDKLSGSICTAVIFMLGWKLLSNKR